MYNTTTVEPHTADQIYTTTQLFTTIQPYIAEQLNTTVQCTLL